MKRLAFLFALTAAALFAQQTMPLGVYGQIPALTGNTAADTATLTPGQMSTLLTGTPTAAANYTTPTATNLCALFPFVQAQNANNFYWHWYIKNTSAGANTITVVAGSGVTLVGTGTAAQNNVRHFLVILTNCTSGSAAAQVVSLETAAF